MRNKILFAAIVVGGISVTGYFLYRYYAQKNEAATSTANNDGNLGNIGSLLGDIAKNGGITSLF